MKVYHRNTNYRFILLWTISILLIVGVIFFAINERFLPALLVFGLAIIAATIRIHGLTISGEKIYTRRYYMFGVKKKELTIPPEKLADIKLWEHGNLNNTGSTDTWLDILFIPALFVAGKKGMTFKTSFPPSRLKSLKLYLSNKEYQLVEELFQSRTYYL